MVPAPGPRLMLGLQSSAASAHSSRPRCWPCYGKEGAGSMVPTLSCPRPTHPAPRAASPRHGAGHFSFWEGRCLCEFHMSEQKLQERVSRVPQNTRLLCGRTGKWPGWAALTACAIHTLVTALPEEGAELQAAQSSPVEGSLPLRSNRVIMSHV